MGRMILIGLIAIAVVSLGLLLSVNTEISERNASNQRRVVVQTEVSSYSDVLERRATIDNTSETQRLARLFTEERNKNEAILIQEKYAALEEQEKSLLMGRSIVVDAGHQRVAELSDEYMAPGTLVTKARVSAGTSSKDGVHEYEYTLLMAELLKDELEKQGAVVVLSRTGHDVSISNKERIRLANELQADAYISLHADGSEDDGVQGYSVLVPSDINNPNSKVVEESQLLGQFINVELITSTGHKSRGVHERDDLTGLNWATVPAVYVELGFKTSPEEFSLMQSTEYKNKLINGITSGITKYFESNKLEYEESGL